MSTTKWLPARKKVNKLTLCSALNCKSNHYLEMKTYLVKLISAEDKLFN